MVMRRRGFTLIELLVALTLFAVIASLLAAGTRLSLDVSARGNKKAESIRTETMVRGLLRNQLQGALPFHYWTEVDSKRTERLAFEGEGGRVRFVSRDGLLDGPDSLPRWVELRRQEMPDGQAKMVLEERRILPPNNEPGETLTAQAEILACVEAHFEYLDTDGDKPKWFPDWNPADHNAPLPSAVRIRCKMETDPMNALIPLDYAESARQGMKLQ